MAEAPQPSGLDDLLKTAASVWQAFIIPTGVALWGAWRWLKTRQDDKDERDRKEREAARSSMGEREKAYMDRVEKDRDRAHERVAELEAQRAAIEHQRDDAFRSADRAWDKSRAWKVRAHMLKHDLGGARGTLNAKLAGEGKPEVDWLDEALPALEDIVADNAAYVERKRAWVTRQNQLRAAARITFDPIDPPDQP